MRKLALLPWMLSLVILTARAEDFRSPDIIVNTNLEANWSGLLVNKIRRLMKNYDMADPFRKKFEEPMVVNESTIQEFLDPNGRELMRELGSLIGLDVLRARTRVTIHGLYYDVQNFGTDFKATKKERNSFTVDTDLFASKVRVRADKVSLELILPNQNNALLTIDVVKPLISADQDKLITVFAKLKVLPEKDNFVLDLQKAVFDQLVSNLLAHPEAIQIELEKIRVPSVSLRVGSKQVIFEPAKIEQMLLAKKDGFKNLLIAQFAGLLKSGMGNSLLKIVDELKIDRDYWIPIEPIATFVRIDDVGSDPEWNNLQIRMSGDFCVQKNFLAQKENCLLSKSVVNNRSRLTENLHQASLDEMRYIFDNGDANLMLSISEDYVNKILVTTIEAGLWDDILKSKGITMGPNKVFIRMDEKGKTATIFLDVNYVPTKLKNGVQVADRLSQAVIGEKMVRFPLIMRAGVRIEKAGKDMVPVFIIKLQDVDVSEKTLTYGRPELGVVSNIQHMRFKKKVLERIRSEIAGVAPNDIIKLPFTDLRGLGLEEVDFISDGYGRMNAILLLQDPQRN